MRYADRDLELVPPVAKGVAEVLAEDIGDFVFFVVEALAFDVGEYPDADGGFEGFALLDVLLHEVEEMGDHFAAIGVDGISAVVNHQHKVLKIFWAHAGLDLYGGAADCRDEKKLLPDGDLATVLKLSDDVCAMCEVFV